MADYALAGLGSCGRDDIDVVLEERRRGFARSFWLQASTLNAKSVDSRRVGDCKRTPWRSDNGYTKNARPDTADRLIKKFTKDVQYGKAAFPDWQVSHMLWSPVVRRSNGNPIYDQFGHLKRMAEEIAAKTGVKITLVINQDYVDAIDALRAFARKETKELKSPVMRFLQIDEWSRKNLKKIRRGVD